ncbi:hypothetical protein ACFW4L_14190 [Streptomyces sp. NPDC058832]|uniref:hypothetical protein n=1 Tax=Streptomyces sp. NPDC058832 TaxID=3346646 RepID=UPI003689D725
MSGGETCITALVDVRLCASLLIAVLTLVAVMVLLIVARPAEEIPGLWPCVVPVVLGLLGLSRRSYLRIIRFRRA